MAGVTLPSLLLLACGQEQEKKQEQKQEEKLKELSKGDAFLQDTPEVIAKEQEVKKILAAATFKDILDAKLASKGEGVYSFPRNISNVEAKSLTAMIDLDKLRERFHDAFIKAISEEIAILLQEDRDHKNYANLDFIITSNDYEGTLARQLLWSFMELETDKDRGNEMKARLELANIPKP